MFPPGTHKLVSALLRTTHRIGFGKKKENELWERYVKIPQKVRDFTEIWDIAISQGI